MIDSHSHSKLSHDGKVSIEELRDRATSLGAQYLAVTEHLDRDYLYCGLSRELFIRQLDLPKYRRDFLKAKEGAKGIYLAYGIEASYAIKAENRYLKELSQYPFDVIINSVHTVYKGDLYLGKAFKHTRAEAYGAYLEAVLESVKASYEYDIVGHIGYVSRYAPYDQKSICTSEFQGIIDEIIGEIVARGKTVECNTNVKLPGIVFLPEVAFLKRYKELGGERVTFSSDAHTPDRICEKYAETCRIVKSLGFENWTIYKERKPELVKIEDFNGLA